jgi:hypothetical protein
LCLRRSERTFQRQYGAFCRNRQNKSEYLLESAAIYWLSKVDAIARYEQLGLPVVVVRYEALTANPEPALRQVCGLLTLRREEKSLAHGVAHHRDLRCDGRAIGGTDPKRPIDNDGVGVWRGVLEEPELKVIREIAARRHLEFYPYEPL